MSQTVEEAKIKIKAACRRVSVAQYKSYTILTPGLSSAALAKEEATSSTFAQGYGGQASKASLEFGEDVKKRLRLLSEVVLRTVKRSLAASFAIFLQKKMARETGLEPATSTVTGWCTNQLCYSPA